MIPSELKLISLGHCYVHLPEVFVTGRTNLDYGSIVSIKSVQTDTEIHVIWNGQLATGNYINLDLTFAQANKLTDELVVLHQPEKADTKDCTQCYVELLNSSDYDILSQHYETSLLDKCRLVYEGLVIPINISQHVKVLVKVLKFEPTGQLGILTKWTEMQFQHNLENIDTKTEKAIPSSPLSHNLGSILIFGERGSGKSHYIKTLLKNYSGIHGQVYNCQQLRGKRYENVKKQFSELLNEALLNEPSIIALDDIDSILSIDPKSDDDKGQDAIYRGRLIDAFCQIFKQLERTDKNENGPGVSIVATCRSPDSLDTRVWKPKGRKYFNKIIELSSPNMEQRCDILKSIISEQKQQLINDITDAQIEFIARKCNSFMPSDLKRLIERSVISACSRSCLTFDSEPPNLILDDLLDSLEGYVPFNLRTVALQVKSQRTFDDVGGMLDIKEDLINTIFMQVKYPKLFKKCPVQPQRSILLYGPPGCGKTLIAEALTNDHSINSISVRGPELLSKYIGASEAAVRELFKRAELARPCIIFFDEFESLVARRGADSTGVTDRVVNQFLTLMDGVEKLSNDVFIIAATSRPDIIDPAILRPGRLDKHIYCPLPGLDDRKDILRVLSKDLSVENLDLDYKWPKLLEGFTGADIQSLLCSAQLSALHEIIGPTKFSSCEDDHEVVTKDLDIIVRDHHVQSSFEAMRHEVEKRTSAVELLYPKQIANRRTETSSRLTLA